MRDRAPSIQSNLPLRALSLPVSNRRRPSALIPACFDPYSTASMTT